MTVRPSNNPSSRLSCRNDRTSRAVRLLALGAVVAALSACGQAMDNQPKYKTYSPAHADVFADRQSARPRVAGTVARGENIRQRPDHLPYKVTMQFLQRGRDQFNAFCAPCHSRLGNGHGIVPKRGFPNPPSYHSQRLRAAPLTHFYDVMTDGYGVMYSYARRVTPKNRWAIAAYIRALQLSQHAPRKDVPQNVTLTGSGS